MFASVFMLTALLQTTNAQILVNEGFTGTIPPTGWSVQNLSSPVGTTGWFQGNPAVFAANSAPDNSYIGANFNNTSGVGTISNWLFLPAQTLKDGDIITFFTRSTGGGFADRLQLRMSLAGASVNAGTTATSVGDFTTLLLDVNPTLAPFGYPATWTQFTATVSGVGAVPTNGRIAFRYFVENGGINGANSDFIGIDNVVYRTFSGPCAGTPAPGNTASSSPSVCANTNFTLSLQTSPTESGLTYQWQSSPTGAAGTYTNIPGATNETLTTQQTAATFYQVVVFCGAASAPSTPIQVTMAPATSCYCLAGAANTAFEKISRIQLNTINNTSTSTAGYENFTAISTTLEPGFPYTFTATISGGFAADQIIAWIDYNQNGSFADAGETIYTSPNGIGPHSGTVIVPFTALPGNTRMRVRLHDTSDGPNATSCGNATWGQVEDYTVNILPVVPCSGTPAPGNTLSTLSTACPSASFTLSLQNFTSGSGVSYQWQSSATGAAGSFTNIPGATSVTYTTTQAAATYYQAVVTCGANQANSTPVQVLLTPFTGCYCASVAGSNADTEIFNVTLNTLNNTSTCASVGTGPGSINRRYSNYMSGTGAPAAPEVYLGTTMPISIGVGTCGGAFGNTTGVWIDFNHDGTFSAAERVYVGSGTGAHTESGNITIPANALQGPTGMRVVTAEGLTPANITACSAYTWGETEDYLVNVVPCVQGVLTTQPVNRTIGCSGGTTFTAAASGSMMSFRWEYRPGPTGPWQFVPESAPFSGTNTGTLTLANTPTTFNGYQFRALYQGACTAPDVSNAVTLTVGPLVGTVTPTSASICAGSLQQISITNTGSPATSSFSSGPIAVAVPDNNPNPPVIATSTIPVSLPAGSLITNMNVRFTMPHTWAGDIVMVLQAPNGARLNLLYYLSGTGGAGFTTGFTNTVISSTGTAFISTGASPYTGTFRADMAVPAAAPPSGPTGFLPTVTAWTGLYSQPSGNWSLYMYDGGAGDLGTLTSWSLEFTYGAPASGTWLGSNIFTNAAGTTPYVAGTPASTVWVRPTTTETYGVIVANALCTADTVNIPVTVSNTLSGVTVNGRDSVCATGTKSITVSAAAGNIVTTAWQVSTDNGTTWTAVPNNNGIYSGANTPTLTITNAPFGFNNYQYRAVVTNPCNSVTSTADTLTVHEAPVVTLDPGTSTQLIPGQTTTLTVSSTPNPVDTYTWFLNGVELTNTGSSLVVDVDGFGDYSVMVTDIYGCTSMSNTVNISANTSNIVFIYPSPNTGQFQVRYQQTGIGPMTRMLNVYDSKGARVYSRSYNLSVPFERMDVDMRKHGKGIYMVELVDNTGIRIKAGRVLIL